MLIKVKCKKCWLVDVVNFGHNQWVNKLLAVASGWI